MRFEVYDGEAKLLDESGELLATISGPDRQFEIKVYDDSGQCIGSFQIGHERKITLQSATEGTRLEFLIDEDGGASYTSTTGDGTYFNSFYVRMAR